MLVSYACIHKIILRGSGQTETLQQRGVIRTCDHKWTCNVLADGSITVHCRECEAYIDIDPGQVTVDVGKPVLVKQSAEGATISWPDLTK
jgi:hypothetical protein